MLITVSNIPHTVNRSPFKKDFCGIIAYRGRIESIENLVLI